MFYDYRKYEKCKDVIEQFRSNEKKLMQLSQESSEKMRFITILFQTVKDHATEKIEKLVFFSIDENIFNEHYIFVLFYL